MKKEIPIQKLKDSISGIQVDKMNDAYVRSQMDELAKSHRNEFYIAIFINHGTADFFVDFKQVELKPSTVLLLYPGQVKRVIETHNIDGWILYFDSSRIEDQIRTVLEEALDQGSLLDISKADKTWFFKILDLMHETSSVNTMGSFHKPALQSLLMACINKIMALFQLRNDRDSDRFSSRSTSMVRAFRKLLRENYKEIKSPKEYARLMNLSLGYLNDTIKTVTGLTVSGSITKEAIVESQRLLCNTDLSIKEVAIEVGYDDPKYFSRIFNKIVKQTPRDFRSSYQKHTRN